MHLEICYADFYFELDSFRDLFFMNVSHVFNVWYFVIIDVGINNFRFCIWINITSSIGSWSESRRIYPGSRSFRRRWKVRRCTVRCRMWTDSENTWLESMSSSFQDIVGAIRRCCRCSLWLRCRRCLRRCKLRRHSERPWGCTEGYPARNTWPQSRPSYRCSRPFRRRDYRRRCTGHCRIESHSSCCAQCGSFYQYIILTWHLLQYIMFCDWRSDIFEWYLRSFFFLHLIYAINI